MTIKTAVILAAGMGTRLKDIGKSIPKGFLKLGEKPIIEESIARLLSVGIERIIIATGHLSEFYDRLQAEHPQTIVTAHNPEYANSGSFYSLYCVKELIEGDFLLLESDLIYEKRALSTAINFPQDNVILLSGTTNAGDEVYVEVSGERIVGMSKNKAELGGEIAGELVGITKISQALFQKMLAFARSQFEMTLKVDYETDALVAVAQTNPVYYTVVSDLLWAEIDDPNHLERAQGKIYPAILKKDF